MPFFPASGNTQAAGRRRQTAPACTMERSGQWHRGRGLPRTGDAGFTGSGSRTKRGRSCGSWRTAGRRRTGAVTPGSCCWPTRPVTTGAAPVPTSRRSWRSACRPPGGCAAAAPGRGWRRRWSAANRGTGRRAASTAGAGGGWWPSPARSRRRGGAGGRCSCWRTGLAGWRSWTRSRTGP